MIKISSDIPGRIKVAFSYNPEYVGRIKTVKAHRWHPEEKYWSFPYSKLVLKEILSAFAGEDLVHQNDVARGYGRVYLPYALDRKYPNASLEWGWQYVFPAKGLSKDP